MWKNERIFMEFCKLWAESYFPRQFTRTQAQQITASRASGETP
jgi:hypothetical protein